MNMRRITKKGDFNFVWLFAIIAGTAIILLAIYGAVKFGTTTSKVQSTELARLVTIVTDPMQAGFASVRKSTIKLPRETVFEVECVRDSLFGYNTLSALIRERSNKDFEVVGVPIRTNNKYLFISDKPGKEFYVFSMPISFAFRIADVVIMDSQEYCFIGLDDPNFDEIRNGLRTLGEKALFGVMNCTDDSIRVCFGTGGNCDVVVRSGCTNPSFCDNEFEAGIVEKGGNSLEYVGNLLYPAIFSERESYLCNVQRLLYRQSVLTNIYVDKSSYMSARNCDSGLVNELRILGQDSFRISSNMISGDLKEIYFDAKSIKDREGRAQCGLWTR
jgi:hypothetical protein